MLVVNFINIVIPECFAEIQHHIQCCPVDCCSQAISKNEHRQEKVFSTGNSLVIIIDRLFGIAR